MITDNVLNELKALRREPKFGEKYPIMTAEESAAMTPIIDRLLDHLLAGAKDNPTEQWVIKQIDPAVAEFYLEDTEVREPCVDYIERIFKIFGMKGSNGAFEKYMLDI